MNFVGHAAIAVRSWDDPRFVYASMLPDFAAMAGTKGPKPTCVVIAGGIALHHATDRFFHHSPEFLRLSQAASRDLARSGVGRGPARAAGHVGVELLLDCAWAQEARTRDAYLQALQIEPNPDDYLEWDPEERARIDELRRALAVRGVEVCSADPERIAGRLTRILARRPRLALGPEAVAEVTEWVRREDNRVAMAAPELLARVERGLQPLAARIVAASRRLMEDP